MSGAVEVIREPDGSFAVACFRTDCPDHGALGAPEPWIAECPTEASARRAAKKHREWIKDQYDPHLPSMPPNHPRRDDYYGKQDRMSTIDVNPKVAAWMARVIGAIGKDFTLDAGFGEYHLGVIPICFDGDPNTDLAIAPDEFGGLSVRVGRPDTKPTEETA